MTKWHELNARRWDWAREARAALIAQLRGLRQATDHSDVAQVMLVGDTQVGKTSLLLRLLGVVPAAEAEVGKVLRAGRGEGKSATAVPIRYQWSGDDDLWSLTQGPERHTRRITGEELGSELAAYRSDGHDGHILWDPAARPLEIGIPGRFAGPDVRRDLRVFDLPGLYAADAAEQEMARNLVISHAPVMNFIVLVVSIDKLTALNEPTITGNPFLHDWAQRPDRFALVFTQAFTDGSVRNHLEGKLTSWTAKSVIDALRQHIDTQLGLSELPSGVQGIFYPVDIGKSWSRLAGSTAEQDIAYARAVTPANEAMLAELRQSLAAFSTEESLYLAASEITRGVESLVHANQKLRREQVDTAERALNLAVEAHAQARARAARAAADLGQAEQAAKHLRDRMAALAKLPIRPVLPDKPPGLTGPAVRQLQVDDCKAWIHAARRAWTLWRGAGGHEFPALPPTTLATDLQRKYASLHDCCRHCELGWWKRKWWETETPDHCYAKMTSLAEDLRAWIRETYTVHATPTAVTAEQRRRDADRLATIAEQNKEAAAASVKDAAHALAKIREAAGREQAVDDRYLAVAHSVRSVHARENQRQVRELLAQAQAAPADERAGLVLAALRTTRDFERMLIA